MSAPACFAPTEIEDEVTAADVQRIQLKSRLHYCNRQIDRCGERSLILSQLPWTPITEQLAGELVQDRRELETEVESIMVALTLVDGELVAMLRDLEMA